MDAQDIIQHFAMVAHPEGGFYRQSYRSAGSIEAAALPPAYVGARCFSTAIVFLLRGGEYSHLHRILQDEVWHFYLGQPLRLVMLSPEGVFSEVVLGQDILHGQHLQFVVPGGYWFGGTPLSAEGFSFVGCTVAPGFDFADFELARRNDLAQRFPAALPCIHEFCLA